MAPYGRRDERGSSHPVWTGTAHVAGTAGPGASRTGGGPSRPTARLDSALAAPDSERPCPPAGPRATNAGRLALRLGPLAAAEAC
jgi:hypothetical protein